MLKSLLATGLILSLLPLAAAAKPAMEMQRLVEKEIRLEQNGKTVIKRVPAESASPGDVLIFTIRYRNTSHEQASMVEARNAIPEGMSYVRNSATGANSDILFSADGGKTFKPAPVWLAGQKTKAQTVGEFTHIQWRIGRIGPGEQGELGYRVRML